MRLENEAPSTLHDYLQVVKRRKWIILQAVIVVPIVAVLLSLREPALYRASAGVLLSTQNFAANLEGLTDPTQYNPDRLLKTQVQLARVPEVARRTVQAAGLKTWDASTLLGTSSVSAGDQSDILTFSVTNGDPELAARLATEYGRQYTRYRFELDTQALRTARASVNKTMRRLSAAGGERSALYASLAEKKAQLDTLESLQTARAVLVRAASGAGKVQPQPRQNAMFGIALGLLLGLGLAVLLEALDSRVRSSDTIAQRLGLRLLARIPEPPRRLRNKNKLVMLAEPYGPEAEAFRILRTHLELANIQDGAQTIMVTSAVEREGKSTTVANLGVALASAGRRVALVDLDLRNASLHRFFNLPAGPGLSDVALGRIPLSKAITQVISFAVDTDGRQPVPEGRLEVLAAGIPASNPGEFVAHLPIRPILEQLKDRSDIVLIDGPPLLQVGDAVALSSAVDALLVVSRINVVRAAMLDDLNRTLRACPAPRLGLVLTGAELETGYGYYSYPRQRRQAVG